MDYEQFFAKKIKELKDEGRYRVFIGGKECAPAENGIVTVRIAKKPGARTRQIEVRAGHGSGHPEARPARKVAVNA